MHKKTALITGISGQDGSYLTEFLYKKGYKVVGIIRKASNWEPNNINYIREKAIFEYGDLLDGVSLLDIINKHKPDEVYNLAAQSSPGESWKLPIQTAEITGLGAHRLFEAIRQSELRPKIYQASSSEMFGKVKKIPQDENTPFNPANPYAASKLYAHSIAQVYRKSFKMFISCGILFNHESPRRGMGFISQKVTYGAACAKLGIQSSKMLNEQSELMVKNGKLAIGNLQAKRDFGFAGDYVEAMWLMLQQKEPDNFIIGTGKTWTIQQLCEQAYSFVGLDWKKFVYVDQSFVRPTETGPLIANPQKARNVLGWKPKMDFEKLIAMMVKVHLETLKLCKKK